MIQFLHPPVPVCSSTCPNALPRSSDAIPHSLILRFQDPRQDIWPSPLPLSPCCFCGIFLPQSNISPFPQVFNSLFLRVVGCVVGKFCIPFSPRHLCPPNIAAWWCENFFVPAFTFIDFNNFDLGRFQLVLSPPTLRSGRQSSCPCYPWRPLPANAQCGLPNFFAGFPPLPPDVGYLVFHDVYRSLSPQVSLSVARVFVAGLYPPHQLGVFRRPGNQVFAFSTFDLTPVWSQFL